MIRTKLFDNGRLNYSIKYKQFQIEITQKGKKKKFLAHEERVKYYKFPFTFGESIQSEPCEDTGEYYRQ